MNEARREIPFGEAKLILERGTLASAASGAILGRLGDTVVLATVVALEEPREGIDFLPLLVDYEERLYAAGKISGSRWVKREGRPSEEAVIAARLIDRPIRPLFHKDWHADVQVIVTTLSYDGQYDPDILSINATSAALLQAGVPIVFPIAACRIGKVDSTFVLNPTMEELAHSPFNLVVAGTSEKVLTVDLSGHEISEEELLEALSFGLKALGPVLEAQKELTSGVEKLPAAHSPTMSELATLLERRLGAKLGRAVREVDEARRKEMIKGFEAEIMAELEGSYKQSDIKATFGKLVERAVRAAILREDHRPDGRGLDELRPIEIQVGLLPRAHGSALFTRRGTQVLSIVTLGAPGEVQFIETLEEETTKRFIHHYNFPPFSTGEVRPLRSVSRREIGHGALIEKALEPLIPAREQFPYTIRVVSEVLSSNGSTSMAGVSASSLALADAGVPIRRYVAGASIGLVTGDRKAKLLTDIQGLEDFAGDMDLKVAGTSEGITAIQLDTKLQGLPLSIIEKGLGKARRARLSILEKMHAALAQPRAAVSPHAPKIVRLVINPAKIRDVIGPGGRIIQKIIADAGGPELTSVDIEQDGQVWISSTKQGYLEQVRAAIEQLSREAKPGQRYRGKVTRIEPYGIFVELWPGMEGLIRRQDLFDRPVTRVEGFVTVGQPIDVVVRSIDELGRVNLTPRLRIPVRETDRRRRPQP